MRCWLPLLIFKTSQQTLKVVVRYIKIGWVYDEETIHSQSLEDLVLRVICTDLLILKTLNMAWSVSHYVAVVLGASNGICLLL